MTDGAVLASGLALGLLLIQGPAVALLWSRLFRALRSQAPLKAETARPADLGQVSVVVPTLNEAARINPCLAGLSRQGYEVREILVVDSRSQDGTPDLVKAAAGRDPRFRLLTDDSLPSGWVGRPWALHSGFTQMAPASGWFLGIDADTRPQPGLVAALLHRAEVGTYDLISLSPRFILAGWAEWGLQPALLMTLIYRFGPTGTDPGAAERVMANGQCFLVRRPALEALGGYTTACSSFCDDVTLARTVAAAGFRVGFLDGRHLLQVRMYEGVRELWREWGRSLDLKDAGRPAQLWGDFLFLVLVQGLPLPVVLALASMELSTWPLQVALALNSILVVSRWALLLAIRPVYTWQGSHGTWAFWLSPLADPLAVLRIGLSSLQRPRQWRGRVYA